jgi:hypothetical protein
MRLLRAVVAPLAIVVLALGAPPAAARLLIEIDKSTQLMTVSRDGAPLHQWPVSTGTRRYDTPSGTFTPFRMKRKHFSREWDDAPMPYSIFFTNEGHAIHGTEHRRAIGRPASHGCVRLEPRNARVLFDLIKREGLANTSVVLAGVTPAPPATAVARSTPETASRAAREAQSDRKVAAAPDGTATKATSVTRACIATNVCTAAGACLAQNACIARSNSIVRSATNSTTGGRATAADTGCAIPMARGCSTIVSAIPAYRRPSSGVVRRPGIDRRGGYWVLH